MSKRHYKKKEPNPTYPSKQAKFSAGRVIAVILAIVVISTMILYLILPSLLLR